MEKIIFKSKLTSIHYKKVVPVFDKLLYSNQFLKCSINNREIYLSVLPGLHLETLIDHQFFLSQFFEHFTFDLSNPDFSENFFNTINKEELKKSPFFSKQFVLNGERLFVIEALLYSLLNKIHGPIKNHTLLSPPFPDLKELHGSGHPFFKIKMAHFKNSPSKLINFLDEILQEFPNAKFRLDANRTMTLNQFYELNFQIQKLNKNIFSRIDYFEEPLKYFQDIFQIKDQVLKNKVAFDENAHVFFNESPWNNLFFKNPLVIKPSLWGISPVVRLQKNFPQKRIILSSAFEHASVMPALHFLAELYPEETHGLEILLASNDSLDV